MNDNQFVRPSRPSKRPGADDDGAGRPLPFRGGSRLTVWEITLIVFTCTFGLIAVAAIAALGWTLGGHH
jgi:hypothetical protein